MSSFLDDFTKVNEKVDQYVRTISEYEAKIQGITLRRNDEIPERIGNLQELLKKIDEYELKIQGYMKVAEQHLSSKNLLTIEAPEGYRVNLNRLHRWAALIDPMSDDDPYAQRVYMVANCDLCFLTKKKEEFQARIVELDKDLAKGSTDEIKEYEGKIAETKNALKDYLDSAEVVSMAASVRKANEGYSVSMAPGDYTNRTKGPDELVPGANAVRLDPGPEFRKQLKDKLGVYYDEKTGMVYLPMEGLKSDSEFALTVECVPARNRLTEMDAGIRNLIFRYINDYPAGSRKVYIIDAVRQNSSLAGGLKSLEGSFALGSIPRNSEQIQTVLEELLSTFNDYDEVLENADTVIEYNKTAAPEKKLTRFLVVLVGWLNAFEDVSKDYIKRIIANYERYGISLVLVDIHAQNDEKKSSVSTSGLSDYVGENIQSIVMSNHDAQRTAAGKKNGFMWYQFKTAVSKDYADTLKAHDTGTSKLGTVYTKRVSLDGPVEYRRGEKKLVLPYGVDSKDEMHSISFENENFAAYLMGASGSGKSTLLHTIITGIIKNYHPDDVELWLADFKMSEFAQYINPLPPHVKYILLDESQELVYDLIDRLTEKMMERQRFFMRHKDMKKVENVPSNIYMPVIFVILDEFSIMSQAVSESEVYKLKLQNLLAKGRALGIKFIFSSQTFTHGISGLTATAKDQIQQRVAMKNSYEEIDQTLELNSSIRTDQVKNWMTALPPHYVLAKYRDGDKLNIERLQVMYFDGRGEEALAPQRRLINSLNSRMKPVEMDQYGQSLDTYVDKDPVIVDGNSYEGFAPKAVKEYIDELHKDTETYIGGEVFALTGTPRLMYSHKPIVLTQESRQNVLLVADNSESTCEAAVITSFIKSFELQGKKAEVWSYERNKVYRAYKDSAWSQYECISDMAEICRRIKKLRTAVENREISEDTLIVLLGFENICADFDLYGASEAPAGIKKTSVGVPASLARALASENETPEEKANKAAFAELRREKAAKRKAKAMSKAEGEGTDTNPETASAPLDENVEKQNVETERKKAGKALTMSLESLLSSTPKTKKLDTSFFDSRKKEVAAMEEAAAAATEEPADTEEETAEAEITENVAPVTEITENAVPEAEKPEEAERDDKEKKSSVSLEIKTGDVNQVDEIPETEVRDETMENVLKTLVTEAQAHAETDGAYNARDDLKELFRTGSRQGLHFMLVLNSYADLPQTGLKTDVFRHRMAFQISADDSRSLFSKKTASELPAHICYYSDSIDRFSFRPYLHKGITWDGWETDENGNAHNEII